ncbi:P-loop containing nucleoside triphosphate hydrolase protein [Cladochytrium replicatum]|nr:P-loop containing nucleoside triphosphate hydrolase protein [Cladochytrium replicatum]
MVPKKAKSKRLSGAQKYKIQKRVAEHNRKLRKEAKKNPSRSKLKKDPGIPNMFPFKDKLLQQVEEVKRQREEEKKQKKAKNSMAQMAIEADRKSAAFEASQRVLAEREEERTTVVADNSRRAYYREFKKVVQNADVILEVLDARDPLGCRTKQIEELILNSGANKRIILILNKIDLVPREISEAWLKYLREEFPTVAFKASTQQQRDNLGQSKISAKKASESLLNSSESLGADTLIKLLKNYSRNQNVKSTITVGVIGFPNVGKSSLINSLKRSKVCNVGATPGVTKATQEILLDKNIRLLDCPGIVFSKNSEKSNDASVLLRNCVKVEQIDDPIVPVEFILSRCHNEQLQQIYGIPPTTNAREFLVQFARVRGRLKRGGLPDVANSARAILQDWYAGRIPYYTLPPKRATNRITASIVEKWSKEFSIADLEADQSNLLSSVKGKAEMNLKMIAVDSSEPAVIDFDRTDEANDVTSDVEDMEDDQEGMEEDSVPPTLIEETAAPQIVILQKKRAAKQRVDEEPDVDEDESALNPQINRNARKSMKSTRKKVAKAQRLKKREADEIMDVE